MINIWMLAAANLRKNKSQTINMMVFVMIAALILNTGLAIYFGIDVFFNERAEALNSPHFVAAHSDVDAVLPFIRQYPGVTEIETGGIVAGRSSYFLHGAKNDGLFVYARAEDGQQMNPPTLLGHSLPLTGDAIYIPHFLMADGGYSVGDDFLLIIDGTELNFYVAGSTEEIILGDIRSSIYRVYVSDEIFSRLQHQFPDFNYTLLSVRLENRNDNVFLYNAYRNEFVAGQDEESWQVTRFQDYYDRAKNARTSVPKTIAAVITAFAFILIAVSLIVIRFRIVNDIEDSMTNIGTLKAVGYRSRQIISSVILQFCFIALVGSISGGLVSQLLLPILTKIMEPQLALIWNPSLDFGLILSVLMLILAVMAFISFITARRINRLYPLVALRGGLSEHNFKKSVMPLEKSQGPLILLLAVKHLLQNKKQFIMITLIMASISFASMAALAVYYNFSVDFTAYARANMGEVPDISFKLNHDADAVTFQENLLKHPDVRKAFGYVQDVPLFVDDFNIRGIAVEDCALLEGGLLVDGFYPIHGNEIALGAVTMRAIDKTIGDWVTVRGGENEGMYVITGLIQQAHSSGRNGLVAADGIFEIEPGFLFTDFNVYLKEGTDVSGFIENAQMVFGDIFANITDWHELTASQLRTISDMLAVITSGTIFIMAFVVIMVLVLVIKTTILRRKRELGLQKALGFTTLQLMNQIALNMTPVIILGIVIGTAGAIFGLNPIFAMSMQGLGIVKTELPFPLDWAVMICIILTLLAYMVSMLAAWRIRKISAYTLITE